MFCVVLFDRWTTKGIDGDYIEGSTPSIDDIVTEKRYIKQFTEILFG